MKCVKQSFALRRIAAWATTFLINHFDLFGLRQVWLCLCGREYSTLQFTAGQVYRSIRHPLYVSWLVVAWATPVITVSHLIFAAGMTTYILVTIQFEERDLMTAPPEYAEFRSNVPMLIPRLRGEVVVDCDGLE